METPKTISKHVRPSKHAPTPKMSERKKSLFGSKRSDRTPAKSFEEDEDDLGIMSPLEFSSSPSRYDSEYNSPISFRGILQHKDTPGLSAKPFFNDKYSDSNKYELISRSNSNLSAVIEISDDENEPSTPKKCDNWGNTSLEVDNATDLSAPITMLTPSETVQKPPKLSFRKSLLEENADKTPQLEEPPTKKQRHTEDEKDSKARTSLSFTENSISTKKFYSSTPPSNQKPTVDISVLAAMQKSAKIFSKNSQPQKLRQSTSRGNNKKTGINRGVFHKIQKIKPKPKKKLSVKKMSSTQLLQAAIDIIDNSPLNAVLKTQNPEQSEQQKKRMQDLLQNMKNPIEMARPLNIKLPKISTNESVIDHAADVTDEGVSIYQSILQHSLEEEPEKENKNKKFFKAKTEKKATFEFLHGLGAVMDQGKISIDKPKPKKRKLFSLFDEDFEYQQEQEEVSTILKALDSVNTEETNILKEPNRNTSPTNMQISTLTSKFAELNSISTANVSNTETTIPNFVETEIQESQKLFPVFYKGHSNTVSNDPDPKRIRTNEWRPIDDNQLQIDAGQKEFGIRECGTCGFIYTQHVPEDEILHQQYHNSCQTLVFKGWEKENKVFDVLEWGVAGRVIAITHLDGKQKFARVENVLKLADLELGFAQIPLHSRAITYLALNSKEIMGICVAQPVQEANKMISDFGIDFCSSESYPVKCGISRIWVSAKHRRQGVGRRLFEAVQCHFVYGYRLSADEIAFSAPTIMGKLFAASVTGKQDFYVFQ